MMDEEIQNPEEMNENTTDETMENAVEELSAQPESLGEASPEEPGVAGEEAVESLEMLAEESASELDETTNELEMNAGESSDEDTEELSASATDEDVVAAMDTLPEPEEYVDTLQMFSILESLLFVSDKPVGIGAFKNAFYGTNVDTRMIKKALQELQSMYAEPTRGVALEEVSGGWQLRTKIDNADYIRKTQKNRPFKLSGPALEVLSVVAYKQPVIKNEVDQVRGVESGHLIRALMEKSLVCFQGKSELPGKPMQYGTTKKFLDIFGLRSLKELPTLDEIDQLLPDGIGEEEEEQKLSDMTGDLSEEVESSYSQGEEELLAITDKLGSINTSTDFFEQEKIRQKEKREADKAQDLRESLDMGEEVSTRDKNWLEKYDARMAEANEEVVVEGAFDDADVESTSIETAKSNEVSEDSINDLDKALQGVEFQTEGLDFIEDDMESSQESSKQDLPAE